MQVQMIFSTCKQFRPYLLLSRPWTIVQLTNRVLGRNRQLNKFPVWEGLAPLILFSS